MVETRLELPDEVAVLQEMVRSQTRHYEEQRSKSEGMFECSEQFDIVLPRAHQNRPDDGSAHP